MNSFLSLPESWPLVTLSKNDPHWIFPWPGGEKGTRDGKMSRDLSVKGKPHKYASLYLVSSSNFTS